MFDGGAIAGEGEEGVLASKTVLLSAQPLAGTHEHDERHRHAPTYRIPSAVWIKAGFAVLLYSLFDQMDGEVGDSDALAA
jgi:hypothetical protein